MVTIKQGVLFPVNFPLNHLIVTICDHLRRFVTHKGNGRHYALKTLKKAAIIKMKQVQWRCRLGLDILDLNILGDPPNLLIKNLIFPMQMAI